MNGSRNNQFALEALEPRVLLSADLLNCASVAGAATSSSNLCIENQRSETAPTVSAALSYNPGNQVEDIFASADTASAGNPTPVLDSSSSETPTPSTEPISPAATQVTETHVATAPQSSTAISNDATASSAATPEVQNPFPQQLVEGLNAANGPPAAGFSGSLQQSILASVLQLPEHAFLLLSSSLGTAGLADSLKAGLEGFAHRLQSFLDSDPVLNTPLPVIVVSEISGSDNLRSAATIKDLLSISVDRNGDGTTDPSGIEHDLQLLDSSGDGKVDLGELVIGGFINKLIDATDGIANYASIHPTDTLADYFNQSTLDRTIGPLEITLSATNTSGTHEISATLNLGLHFSQNLPVDLGFGGDKLGLNLDSSIDVDASMSSSFKVGVLTSGEAVTGSDFFLDNASITGAVNATLNPVNASLNVGFLGASVNNGLISLTASATGSVLDPRSAAVLGFTPLEDSSGSITAGQLPGTGNAEFMLRVGNTDSREILAGSLTAGMDIDTLRTQVQTAIDAAGFSNVVFVDKASGRLVLKLPDNLDITPLRFSSNELSGAGSLTGAVL